MTATSVVTTMPGQDTLIACWTALAQTSAGAEVFRGPATTAAVFPSWVPLNNAILVGDDGSPAARVVEELRSLYADAGIDVWALWVLSGATDLDAPDGARQIAGLARDTTTLVMRADLKAGAPSHPGVVRTSVGSIARITEDEPVPMTELAEPDVVAGLTAWALVHDGVAVSSAWSFLHERDCGVYAVETLSPWRRRGLARSLLQHVFADAHARGARTASLQSTRMGQPLYESLGFEPVGRYEEWISG
jgi:GNAT superfamily N-acetyltransferase